MTNNNYARFLKQLGKLAYAFDQAGGNVTTQQQAQQRAVEQFADASYEFLSITEINILAGSVNNWTNLINAGPTAIQTLMENIAIKIITSPDFIASLTTVPANNSILAVLTAWAADFVLDSKTLTTSHSTGFVNFFNSLLSSGSVSFPQSGSPSYPDSVYCVLTFV